MKKILCLLVLLIGAAPAFAAMDPCDEPYMPCAQNLYNPVGPARQYQDAVRRRHEQEREERQNTEDSGMGPQDEDANPYDGPPAPRSNVRRVPPGTPYGQ